jgi:hypothetical protein
MNPAIELLIAQAALGSLLSNQPTMDEFDGFLAA